MEATHEPVTLAKNENTLYFFVWMWLVVLLVAGLSIFGLPIPREAAVLLIFTVAAVKAVLVVRNYMHLKHEHYLIYFIVLVPLIFFLGLALMLIPDIVFRHGM
jgi:caa(3)-type oxidase subunit IV